MNKVYQMPSEAQIAKWKKEHGSLHKLTVKVPGQNDAICIVRAPKVSDLSYAASAGENDDYKTILAQLKSCWLSGDERINTKLSIQQSVVKKMGGIFPVYPRKIETIEVTPELIEKFKTQGATDELISKVQVDGTVRRIEITIGVTPVMVVKEGKEEDTREKIEAYFIEPDLKIKEVADLMSAFLDKGSVLINESFIAGDARFKDHTDEPIAFASYFLGNFLIEELTAEVEKL